MTSERWQRIEELYHSAREREGNQRAAFLKEACAGDDALRQEVESLLAREKGVEGFLEAPAPADGSGGVEQLTEFINDYQHTLGSWSPDGVLAFEELNPATGRDIWVLRLSDRKAQP